MLEISSQIFHVHTMDEFIKRPDKSSESFLFLPSEGVDDGWRVLDALRE